MSTKKSVKQPVKARKLERPNYSSFKLQKKIRNIQKISSGWSMFKCSFYHLYKHKWLFLSITLIYFMLSLVLVTGLLGSSQIIGGKETLSEVFQGVQGRVLTSFALFSLIASGGSSASTETGSIYQTILLIFFSLVVIWALRQTYAGESVSIKDCFYKSTSQLVPFVLVLLIIVLQFLPFLIGVGLYNLVTVAGFTANLIAKLLWFLLMIFLGLLSLYMVSSSLFGLYIVTLPGMTPMKSVRSARELVRLKRWQVIRKLLLLPVLLILLAFVLMTPVLLYVTIIAEWVFLFLSLLAVVFFHTYTYKLYRELL